MRHLEEAVRDDCLLFLKKQNEKIEKMLKNRKE